MLVRAKQQASAHMRGLPVSFMFNRLIHAGDVFEIPDDPVPHMEESDFEKDEKGKPLMVKIVSRRVTKANGQEDELSELESRRIILARSPEARRWSKQGRELYLKFMHFAPSWMEIAPRGSVATVDPEKSMPTRDGSGPPDVAPGKPTSVGEGDTGGMLVNITKLSIKEAVDLVNKTNDPALLSAWSDQEEGSGNPRARVKNVLDAQLRTANNA